MKDWKNYLLVCLCLASVAVISCVHLLDSITPADVHPKALKYAALEPNDIGFPSLYDAKNVRDTIIIKHRTEQLNLLRLAEDDKFAYEDAIGFIGVAIEEAQATQDWIVGSEDQPFSILGILAGVSGGTLIGKELFKRRKDYTPEQVEVAVVKAKDEGRKEAKS